MAHRITLVPGDGIGPEVTSAAQKVLAAAGVAIDWDVQNAGADVLETRGTVLPPEVLASIRANKVALKGPITTPVGKGFRSVNVTLRQELDLYANVRPVRSLLGAGLVGGLGIVPGANIGESAAVFEAVHGSAPDIAGQGIANPTAVIQSGVMMLRYIGEMTAADRIEKALTSVYSAKKTLTGDLGGTASTVQFTEAICALL